MAKRQTKACPASLRGPASDRPSQAKACLPPAVPLPPVSFRAARGLANRPRRRIAGDLSEAELETLWRPSSDFIGPVAPPMWLWQRDRAKQAIWRKAHGLE